MIQINTEKATAKANGQKIATGETILILSQIIANPTLIKAITKKKDVIVMFDENPFTKNKREVKFDTTPSEKAIKYITEEFKKDGSKDKKFLKIMIQSISVAANTRKIRGELFYMNEVRRITRAIIRSMSDCNIDNEIIINMK